MKMYNLAKVLFTIVMFLITCMSVQAQEKRIPAKTDTSIVSHSTDTTKNGTALQKSVSISEISNEELNKQGGGTQGLKAMAGLSVVSSSDGPANIRVRGLPGGGYRYVGYMEDGLPVLPTGFYAVPSSDQYFKSDLTVKTVEGTRGGNAPILLSNTPGALINYISKTGADVPYGHFKYTAGLSQQSHRADANVGGNIGQLWQYNAGGFYRTDKGIVPANFTSNQGGQFKLNITRQLGTKGFIRVYGKYLDDKVANSMKGIYAYNSDHIAKAMPGFDMFTQTLVPNEYIFRFNLPEGNTYTSDLSEQYHNKLYYGGLLLNINLGSWTMNNRLRYQSAKSRIVADAIPGIFAAENMSLYRLDGTPFNQSNGYYTNHSIKDVTRSDHQLINYLTFKRNIGKHTVEIGAGIYLYNSDSENVNFSFKSELANQPHVLKVGTDGDTIKLAALYDPSGHNKYNGLTTTSSLYINSDLILTDHVNMNVSARFDNQDITGKKARFEGSSVLDNGKGYVIVGKNRFSDNRNYWSASMGLTYNKIRNLSLFARATRAYNAINIDDLGSVDVNSENLKNRTVYSFELGDRYNNGRVRFSQSFSYTSIDNLLLVVNIPNAGGSVISQSTFASSRTYSFEMEFGWLIVKNLNLQLTSTLQDVKFTQYKFTVKNTAAPEYSGKEMNWKGNVPGSMPSVILQYSLNYTIKNIDIYCKANTTGKIYTTDADTYTLPAYTEVSTGAGYRFLKKYSIRAWANNLFNNRNLMDGNSMGEQFIDVNTLVAGQPMIGRVILPRSFWLSLEYRF